MFSLPPDCCVWQVRQESSFAPRVPYLALNWLMYSGVLWAGDTSNVKPAALITADNRATAPSTRGTNNCLGGRDGDADSMVLPPGSLSDSDPSSRCFLQYYPGVGWSGRAGKDGEARLGAAVDPEELASDIQGVGSDGHREGSGVRVRRRGPGEARPVGGVEC